MTHSQKLVHDWMHQYGQETPKVPSIPNVTIRQLRARLMLEECLETINALGFHVLVGKPGKYHKAKIEEILFTLRATPPDLQKIADGCSDSHVVTLGTEVACGLNAEENFREVMRSNFSKLWKPSELNKMPPGSSARAVASGNEDDPCILVQDAGGKVIKSPSYSPATLKIT